MTKPSLIFPSLAAANSATGVPIRALRTLKGSGCPGFDASGRVDVGKLLKWALDTRKGFKVATDQVSVAKARLLELQALKVEADLDEREGRLVDVDQVRKVLIQIVNEIQTALDNCPDPVWAENVFKPAFRSLLGRIKSGKP